MPSTFDFNIADTTVTNPQSGGGLNWGNAASSLMPALGTFLTAGANVADLEAKNKAIETNMASAVTTYKLDTDLSYQQLDDLNRAAGDKMTNEAINTMVSEARVIAASAETGTSGGTTTLVTKAGRMQQSLNNAQTIRQARNSKIGILRGMTSSKLNLDNQLKSLASGVTSPFAAGLSTANAAMSGYQSGMNMMNSVEQERYYGYNTQTKPKYQG